MNILILGNGFDLAHNLKTKYSDFLDYCEKQFVKFPDYKPSNNYYTNLWIRHFLNVQGKIGDKWIDLEEEIYKVILNFSKFQIMLLSDVHREFIMGYYENDFNFYNFEKYLSDPFGKAFPSNGYLRLDKDDGLHYKIYFSTPRGIVNFLYDQLREFTKLFENYLLSEVLEPIKSEPDVKFLLKHIQANNDNNDIHILNFNYTDTFERFCKFNEYCDLNIIPVYVHGKVSRNDKCNLVFGTHGFEDWHSTISADFNIFKKHNQRHKYGTIEAYQDLLREIKNSQSLPTFHIIGHSLDRSDENILKHILLANTDAMINIYYHNEEAQERLMKRIDAIIGEEEVMTKVRFIDQKDPERGILLPKQEYISIKN